MIQQVSVSYVKEISMLIFYPYSLKGFFRMSDLRLLSLVLLQCHSVLLIILSFLQMALFYILLSTMDIIRTVFGPLPLPVCSLIILAKNCIYANVAQITAMMTLIRFVIIFFYKSLPVMEDKLLSVIIYAMVNIFSFIAAFSRMFLAKRPYLPQVSTFIALKNR